MVNALVIYRVQTFFKGASTLIGDTPITFELLISLFILDCSIYNIIMLIFVLKIIKNILFSNIFKML